jgi:hypothetical protein
MSDQITFKYNHCSPEDLHKDLSFSEDSFGEILQECFETNQHVSSIEVTFEANPSQATDKFSCAINVHTTGKSHYVIESGEDGFSKIATQACRKAVKVVRDEKQDINRDELAEEIAE